MAVDDAAGFDVTREVEGDVVAEGFGVERVEVGGLGGGGEEV